jgi:cobalt-precorrin 5A hydrolase/precorrin-3B C17-methyltransferase
MTGAPVFVALTDAGAALARRLMAGMAGAQLHGLDGRVADADRHFARTTTHLQSLYEDDRMIIGICAAAILIRALAPVLQDKRGAPPVIAVAEDGSAVAPLLGGHHGANALARAIGAALGVSPAITTAGETRFGVALDEPPPGWAVSNRDVGKAAMAAMLAGAALRLANELPADIDAEWLTGSGASFTSDADAPELRLTERAANGGNALCLHPRTLALGVGCERGVETDALAALVDSVIARSGLARESLACIATIDLKEDEAAIRALAARMNLPLRLFTAEALEAETPRLANPSDTVFAAVGCHGVAEAAALAAAGPDARLTVAKQKGARATAAIARAPAIIASDNAGRPPGLLTLVGIGPGQDGWRAPAATDAVARADHVVGYGLYIDLLGKLADGKQRHAHALGEERQRCAEALDLAASGETVALVCSGDAGIYAMASLVYELVDTGGRADWRRVAIAMEPGISALQALAARGGAPLGHDFCAISLSDLLTPWPAIEARLRAAAEGDFVVALYNPVSRRRTEQLGRARDILLAKRPAETPVLIGRNLGRADEKIEVIALGALDSGRVDMLTTVIVGSSETRRITSGGSARVYTPRGYAGKKDAP